MMMKEIRMFRVYNVEFVVETYMQTKVKFTVKIVLKKI